LRLSQQVELRGEQGRQGKNKAKKRGTYLLMATAVSDRDPDLGTGRPPEEGIGRPCGNPELKVVRELERRRRRESS